MDPRVKQLVAQINSHRSKQGWQAVESIREQLPDFAELLAVIAQEQEKSSQKVEGQTNELIALTGQIVSLTRRVVGLTWALVWMSAIIVIFTVVLFWFAFVQTQILKRDEKFNEAPQHIQQTSQDQNQAGHNPVNATNH
jgi:cytoskeletal protein RodZ